MMGEKQGSERKQRIVIDIVKLERKRRKIRLMQRSEVIEMAGRDRPQDEKMDLALDKSEARR